jgi:hypothetical protein
MSRFSNWLGWSKKATRSVCAEGPSGVICDLCTMLPTDFPGSTSSSRARVTWPVQLHTSDGSADGVIVTINHMGAFMRCQKPLRLSESFQLTIEPPENEPITVTAEVVFSNVYGPDDHITPPRYGCSFCRYL